MLEYFLQFFGQIFSPELDPLEVVIEHLDSSALKRSRDLFNVTSLLASEG